MGYTDNDEGYETPSSQILVLRGKKKKKGGCCGCPGKCRCRKKCGGNEGTVESYTKKPKVKPRGKSGTTWTRDPVKGRPPPPQPEFGDLLKMFMTQNQQVVTGIKPTTNANAYSTTRKEPWVSADNRGEQVPGRQMRTGTEVTVDPYPYNTTKIGTSLPSSVFQHRLDPRSLNATRRVTDSLLTTLSEKGERAHGRALNDYLSSMGIDNKDRAPWLDPDLGGPSGPAGSPPGLVQSLVQQAQAPGEGPSWWDELAGPPTAGPSRSPVVEEVDDDVPYSIDWQSPDAPMGDLGFADVEEYDPKTQQALVKYVNETKSDPLEGAWSDYRTEGQLVIQEIDDIAREQVLDALEEALARVPQPREIEELARSAVPDVLELTAPIPSTGPSGDWRKAPLVPLADPEGEEFETFETPQAVLDMFKKHEQHLQRESAFNLPPLLAPPVQDVYFNGVTGQHGRDNLVEDPEIQELNVNFTGIQHLGIYTGPIDEGELNRLRKAVGNVKGETGVGTPEFPKRLEGFYRTIKSVGGINIFEPTGKDWRVLCKICNKEFSIPFDRKKGVPTGEINKHFRGEVPTVSEEEKERITNAHTYFDGEKGTSWHTFIAKAKPKPSKPKKGSLRAISRATSSVSKIPSFDPSFNPSLPQSTSLGKGAGVTGGYTRIVTPAYFNY